MKRLLHFELIDAPEVPNWALGLTDRKASINHHSSVVTSKFLELCLRSFKRLNF